MNTNLPDKILNEIKEAIVTKDYGSVEIYIESGRVVQITERTIKKTSRVDGKAYNSSLNFGKSQKS